MKKTLGEIASFLGGRIKGDPEVVIHDIRGIDEARKGDLTFIANPKYLKSIETTEASAILVSPQIEGNGRNLIVVDDPYIALGRVLGLFYPEDHDPPKISKETFIEEGAIISKDATIYPGCIYRTGNES